MGVRLEYPRFSAVDSAGAPLNGGKLYSYEAGTSTAKTLYADRDLTVATTNPVILDSSGEATIYGSGLYKLVLKTSADVTMWTLDYVTLGQYYDEILLFKGSSRTYSLEVDSATDRLCLYPDTNETGELYIGKVPDGTPKYFDAINNYAENNFGIYVSNCNTAIASDGDFSTYVTLTPDTNKRATISSAYKTVGVNYSASIELSANSESLITLKALNQWSVAYSEGVLKILPVYKASVATDEYLDLPIPTQTGLFWGRAKITGGNNCYILAIIGSDGVVTVVKADPSAGAYAIQSNWTTDDTGTDMTIYDAGTTARIKNKAAAVSSVWGIYFYS